MAESGTDKRVGLSLRRLVAALVVGLIGCVFVWVAAPLNNLVLGNSGIADDYLPVAALFVVLVLVFAANPLLRRLAPRLALGGRQLALIFAMVLVACIVPSSGFLGFMPHSLASSCIRASQNPVLAKGYAAVAPPACLFPDQLGHNKEVEASWRFVDQLRPGESVPWGAWLAPLLGWGGFLVPWAVMMIALAIIVLPQWRDNERLSFPLVTIERALIEPPEPSNSFT